MPNLQNNKVELADGTTVMDITDTTATESDVAAGEVFYKADGTRSTGTGNYMNKVSDPTTGDILITDANGQAVDSGVQLSAKQDTLSSGTNIKTINGQTVLGNGNVPVVQGDYDSSNNSVELEQGTDVITFTQTADGVVVVASNGSTDFIDKELVSKGYVSQYQTLAQVKAEIVDELANFEHVVHRKVTVLPATGEDGVRYMLYVPDQTAQGYHYEEYVYIDNDWIDLGDATDANLENYYDKAQTDALLADKADTTDLPARTSELINDGDGTHNFVTFGDAATENAAGVVKLNPSQNIDVDANGKLTVGGRIGQFEGTTGLFAPNNREPRNVGNYSFLMTDALGVDMSANRAMAVVSGYGIACRSAAAGSTEYRIQNNYQNRIIAMLCVGGYASRDEATSIQEQIVQVVSVTINGSSCTPNSSANPSGTTSDIVIKTAQTLNPDSAITNIRLFGTMTSYATVHAGNGIKSGGGGRNLLLGGGVTKDGSSNDNCLVGNGIYSSGNGNACFGRYHIARKNRGFFAGTGHDSTNAPSEGASAVGQYSYMDAKTLFAVGNGTSQTARSNAFEARADGIVLKSPNGTRYKIAVDNSGNITTTAI